MRSTCAAPAASEQSRAVRPRVRPWLSIIIPARDEAAFIGPTVERARGADGAEVIVVDGGSGDDTVRIARGCGAVVLSSPPGRGAQMNLGAARAVGQVLLFLHADTLLPDRFDQEVAETIGGPGVVAGAFRLWIDARHRSLRLIEAMANLRSRFVQMPYGDQAIFLKTETFRGVGGFAALPVMEDVELVRRLRRLGRVGMARSAATTSARRWLSRGVWRTTLTHRLMISAYHLGVSPQRISTWRGSSNGTVATSRTDPGEPGVAPVLSRLPAD